MADELILSFDREDDPAAQMLLTNALFDRGIHIGPKECLRFDDDWRALIEEYGGAKAIQLQIVPDTRYPYLCVIIRGPAAGVRAAFARVRSTGKWPVPRRRRSG